MTKIRSVKIEPVKSAVLEPVDFRSKRQTSNQEEYTSQEKLTQTHSTKASWIYFTVGLVLLLTIGWVLV